MKFSFFTFPKRFNHKLAKGFTLLELLVVFSVVSVLAGSGFASFVSYSKKQVLDQAAADIKTGIDTAKFNAISRVKPTVFPCSPSTPLNKYRIKICGSGVSCSSASNLYEIDAACSVNGTPTWTDVLTSKKRNSTLTSTIASAECGVSSGIVMQFSVLKGIDAPCRVVVTDGTSSRTVCIDGGGNTSVKDGSVSCGSAYLATTPAPTSPPITLLPTPTGLPDPPTISSQTVTSINATSATLNSIVNPNRGQTSITYRYDSSNGVCSALAQTLAGPSISGSSNVSPNAANLSSLLGNTIYYYCATADNTSVGGGLTQGIGQGETSDNQSSNFLTAPGAPTINSVGSPTLTSLAVSWSAPSPLGSGGSVTYNVYACNRNSSPGCTPGGVSDTPIVTNLAVTSYTNTSLVCNTTYAYVVKAVNAAGVSSSSNIYTGATTWCDKPTVTTSTPAITSVSTANLQSIVNPNNDPTTVYYKWGTTNSASCSGLTGTTTAGVGIGGGNTNVSPNAVSISSLVIGTTYYVCAYASNLIGTTYGTVIPFSICYRDADGDGYGAPGVYGSCGAGYVTNNNDCDDSTNAVVPGSTRTMYQAGAVSCGTACFSQTQTCGAGGVWSGTYTSTSCTASSRIRYNPLNSACGIYSYTQETQTCQTSGAWTGTYTYTSPPPQTNRTMYQPLLSSCGYYGNNSEIQYCQSNGVFTGSYTSSSPATVATRTAYASSCGTPSCSSQFQTCTSGGWNGAYTYLSCSAGTTYYRDLDGDSYGSSLNGTTTACSQPAGYVANQQDCCDNQSQARPGQSAYYASSTGCSGISAYDWNCDGSVTTQYNSNGFGGTATGTCFASPPSGTVGYSGSVSCCGPGCSGTFRACYRWSTTACGSTGTANAYSDSYGQVCPGYVAGYGWALVDVGSVQQACH